VLFCEANRRRTSPARTAPGVVTRNERLLVLLVAWPTNATLATGCPTGTWREIVSEAPLASVTVKFTS
jgi:hypothetical protein